MAAGAEKLSRPRRGAVKQEAPGAGAATRALLAHRNVWIAPALFEGVLAATAAALSVFFYQVMTGQAQLPALLALGVLLVLGTALRIWTAAAELFMPRPVVLLTVLPLGAAFALAALALLLPGDLLARRLSILHRAILVLPLLLFVLRSLACVGKARFAPRLDTLRDTRPAGEKLLARVKETLAFWCS